MADVERTVRDELAVLAATAPEPGDLVGAVRRRLRRRRRALVAGPLAGVAAVSVVVALVTGPSLPPVVGGVGEVAAGGAGSCHEMYSTETLPDAQFAFDGTVTGFGRPVSGGGGGPSYVGVKFTVHRWFEGGSGDAVTVDLQAPVTVVWASEESMSYGVGTRLLVAGAARWGGAPLDKPVAWPCGFTRYWDAQTAATWAQVFG